MVDLMKEMSEVSWELNKEDLKISVNCESYNLSLEKSKELADPDKSLNLLKIIINGETYFIPFEFAKLSPLLIEYTKKLETLFLYEDKNLLNLIISYWNTDKEMFLFKLLEYINSNSVHI